MSIVPKEVNITIVTLSSTLDDIFGCTGAASALLAPLCSLTMLDQKNLARSLLITVIRGRGERRACGYRAEPRVPRPGDGRSHGG